MASCTQVETMLQAWIDDELGDAERVILEQHLAECRVCRATAQKHQRSAAILFESLRGDRLHHNLRQGVLDNLPEMSPSRIEVKSSVSRLRIPLAIPAVAAALFIALAGALFLKWSGSAEAAPVVGMVLYSSGHVMQDGAGLAAETPAATKDRIRPGRVFETGKDSALLLTLKGPSHMRVRENSRLRVDGARRVNMEEGHMWLDVASNGEPFVVSTPTAEVTVVGTTFDVFVDQDRTVVSVTEGTVRVNNGLAQTSVTADEQVVSARGLRILEPVCLAHRETGWVDAINPDAEAAKAFAVVFGEAPEGELRADQFFVIPNSARRPIAAVKLTWQPAVATGGFCSYYVHVYDDKMVELFSEHVDGAVFAEPGRTSHLVRVPNAPVAGIKILHVKIVPDFTTGATETSLGVAGHVAKAANVPS